MQTVFTLLQMHKEMTISYSRSRLLHVL